MDPNRLSTASEAHPESMDFLSRAWCDFAVQALHPEQQQQQKLEQAIVLRDIPAKEIVNNTHPTIIPKMEKSVRTEARDSKSLPQWQSNDLKSWIWMQQAMHPELNYNGSGGGGFKKKWLSWKIPPLKNVQIKKWVKEMKEKRKEGKRLERAEVHAAVSIAGLAAALAAVAAEKTADDDEEPDKDREMALASAANLVAAQCAQMAELMGAKREQLSSIIGSAISATNTTDILTLTAAAATSLRGAQTLKARTGCINRRTLPVLPIEDTKDDLDSDFEKNRMLLAKGARLSIETSEARCMVRVVSLHLTNETKIILKIKKLNFFNVITSNKESIVLDQHIELYRDSGSDEDETCYQISLTTTRGIIKLDMADDFQRCKIWTCTINHMLRLSSSLAKYELQFCKY
ncbi:hypothetical protein V2J09_009915 [Rumex salicifolius]